MIETMKCGKVVDSQGKHIHIKFCPICSGEDESKKKANLDAINVSKIETKIDNLEAVNDSKTDLEASQIDNKETDSDSKSEGEDTSLGSKALGVALLGFGLFIGLLYLAYRWAARKTENNEISNETERESLSEWQVREKQRKERLTSSTRMLGIKNV